MIYHLSVECPYDSAYNATLVISRPVPKEKNECKMDNFEYTLVSGNIREKMEHNTNLRFLPISSDDHFRFSLFDSAKVEKKYDIDLSSVIHSYTIDGDSVRITMPSNLIRFSVKCPYCPDNTNDMCRNSRACVREAEYEKSTMTVGLDSSWGKYFLMRSWLESQGPLGNDSIDISAQVYFRE